MKNRSKRLIAIRQIISNRKISNQDELLNSLKEEGFDFTQATLSRDLKFLKIARVPDSGKGYVYRLQESLDSESQSLSSNTARVNFLADGFKSINFSGNLAVIKTLPGYASSIAAVIDDADPFELIGTIAGDDNILLVMREGVSRNDLINTLILILPKLEEKIK
ncbi:MAG: ArgR family transcriptional regulator [Bacteroidota bacterium]|nr:ArgR family transcriptional regulator [Bacteroidota bacterium]MDP4205384.1 ArgR family transcriptional regulator [Bacteroidota bacterium]